MSGYCVRMANRDLYAILGVPRTATADEIKKTYRGLAKQYHPDRNPDDPSAEEKFKEITAAFAVLGDEDKRELYDDFGINGLREGFDPQAARNYQKWASGAGRPGGPAFDGGFADLFGNLGGGAGGARFGGFGDLDDILGGLFGGASRRHPPRRGRDLEQVVTVSVREAIEGGQCNLPHTGIKVRVPKGVAPGQKMRVPGKGHHGPAGAGDLFLRIEIAPPPGFAVIGDDLELDVPLTVLQAMEGATVTVPTPEGTTIQIKVPACTQSGRRLRLRGKGMPCKGGQRGDLYARTMVRVPTTDDIRAVDLARELESFY